MSNVINNDAKEFGLHVKQGGWRLGLLVARSVEVGTAGRPKIGVDTPINSKVSATAFASNAGTTKDRVLAYLRAWNKAADEGVVPPADSLSPGQELDIDVDSLPNWTEFYTNNKGSRVSQEKIEAEKEAAAEAARIAAEAKAAKDAAAAETRAAKALADALEKQKREQAQAEAKRAAEAAARIRAEEQAKAKAAAEKEIAALKAKLADAAKKAEFDLSTLSEAQKAQVMTMLANDPEKAAEYFKAANAERDRKNREAAEKAAADEQKRQQNQEIKRQRELAILKSKEYAESPLNMLDKKVMPLAFEFRNLLQAKGITQSDLNNGGWESLDPIYNMAYALEAIAASIREQADLLNVERQLESAE